MAEILVVEDDAGLNRGITLTLVKERYSVDSASCIKEANELIKRNGMI